MKFTTILALTSVLLLTNEVEAVSLRQALVQVESQSRAHADTLAQLESAAESKGFFDFLKKAGDWITGAVKKVTNIFTGKKAQRTS